MNRFPQESHSPTTIPSSPVENRRGAPHWRHGRARGPCPSDRGGLSRSAKRPSGFRTNTVVVSHSAQTASIAP